MNAPRRRLRGQSQPATSLDDPILTTASTVYSFSALPQLRQTGALRMRLCRDAS